MDKGNIFPHMKVFELPTGELWLVDGFHRHKAHKLRSIDEVEVEILTGSEQDATDWALFNANYDNGQRLTPKDRAAIARKVALDPRFVNMSTREVERLTNVSHSAIARWRAKLGADGHLIKGTMSPNNVDSFEYDLTAQKEAAASASIRNILSGLKTVDKWQPFSSQTEFTQLIRALKTFIEEHE